MTTDERYANLIVQLDQRFRELGLHPCDVGNFYLKAILRGELMMVVTNGEFANLTWVTATEKPLESLFLFTV